MLLVRCFSSLIEGCGCGGLVLWCLVLGVFFEGGGCGAGGEGRDVFGCALMRALAGTAYFPFGMHLIEVTLLA